MKRNLILLLVLAVITAAVAYFYFNRSDKTYENTFADFSIADTATVDKVIISDNQGKKLTLKREEGKWSLNDSLEARPELTSLILRVFKDIVVQSPVSASAKANTVKRLAAVYKKVEIFQDGNSTPTKTWYVGEPTVDHFGTTVLLELPDEGTSPDPYVIEIPWHKGFITPMFIADYIEWMQTPVFVYPTLEFSKITLVNYRDPASSFTVEKNKDQYSVKDLKNNRYIPGFDTLFVRDYTANYRAVYYEVRDKYLTTQENDSMLKSQPLYMISVTDNNGKQNQIKIYEKKGAERTIDPEAIAKAIDPDRYYAHMNNKDVVLIQKQAFAKLLIKLSDIK